MSQSFSFRLWNGVNLKRFGIISDEVDGDEHGSDFAWDTLTNCLVRPK